MTTKVIGAILNLNTNEWKIIMMDITSEENIFSKDLIEVYTTYKCVTQIFTSDNSISTFDGNYIQLNFKKLNL